jgi:MFS family permease
MLMPLASLTLEHWETPATLIGLNSSMSALAMLACGPFLAGWVRELGAVRALTLGTGVATAAILALPLFPALGPWFVLRFLIGAGMALPWLVAETWVNAIAREANRARVIAVYSIALFAGLSLGPQILQVTGSDGSLPFAVCAVALALSALPMVIARQLLPSLEIPPGLRIHQVLARAPTVAGAALIAGLSESACYMLLPVYGVRAGVGEAAALTWLTVLILGAVAWQFPMGWLADRIDRQRLLGLAGIAGALVPLALLAAVPAGWLVWPLLFLYGGIALGYYTVGLAHLGARFAPGELAVANAGFMVLYETGTTVGPALAGAGMEFWAPHGYLVVLSLFGAGFAALVAWRRRAGNPR